MDKKDKNRVCPVELSGSLDTKFRRLIQNPVRILKPYILPGMEVLDLGCGPGYFTTAIAELAGESGKVTAADLQEGMLDIVRKKIQGTELEKRIVLHRCEKNTINYSGKADFIFAFYVIHEIPDKQRLFSELYNALKPGGSILIVEPPLHVSKNEFRKMIDVAVDTGFSLNGSPRLFPNKSVLFRKN